MAEAPTQVGRQDEGWVIIHPTGYWETDYFHVTQFSHKPLAGDPVEWEPGGYAKHIECTPERWREVYRPDCQMVRLRLVPIEDAKAAEPTTATVVTPPQRDIERSIEIQFFSDKDGKWKSNGKAYGEMEWIADLELHMNLEPEYLWRVVDVVKYSTPFVTSKSPPEALVPELSDETKREVLLHGWADQHKPVRTLAQRIFPQMFAGWTPPKCPGCGGIVRNATTEHLYPKDFVVEGPDHVPVGWCNGVGCWPGTPGTPGTPGPSGATGPTDETGETA